MSLAGIGRILAQAREKAGLSCEEVATRLRLTSRQVEALESGNMEALPGPAFVRGFIRNYAKLLQIDAQPLLEASRNFIPDLQQAHISLHTENILIEGRERNPWRSYLMIAVLLIAMLAAWIWYTSEDGVRQETPVDASEGFQEKPLPETVEIPLPQPMAPPSVPSPLETPSSATADAAAPAQPATLPAEVAPAVPQSAKLKLVCAQAGWVSVTDRDGKEIFNKMIPAGGSELVEGMPPFKVVLGNAIGMEVTYNDAPVDLSLHTKGGIARFSLE
jgi:cytoskeleton protein RodZ